MMTCAAVSRPFHRAFRWYLDRAGGERIAPRDEVARDRSRLADRAAALVTPEIDVDMIIMKGVGARREHGREQSARARMHVVQERTLLRRPAPAVAHGDLASVGEREGGA